MNNMPKVKISKTEERNRIARSIISKYMELNAVNDEQLSNRLPFTRRTLQNKRRRPETFTVFELRALCDALKIPEGERGMLIG